MTPVLYVTKVPPHYLKNHLFERKKDSREIDVIFAFGSVCIKIDCPAERQAVKIL
jgi:hypothetical protein